MSELSLYNTLGRKIEFFKSIEKGKVKMYCCGPTVYAFAHIGNLRTYLFEDLLRRTFEINGYNVTHVMNITDVGHLTSDEDYGEDKVEMSAKKTGKTAWDLVKMYEEAFMEDLSRLNIKLPNILPKPTDHIKEQIDMVKILEKKGYTYSTRDGIYFDVSKWSQYGKLSGQKLEDKLSGARVEVNDEKRNPADFALWKFSPSGEKRQMEWDSPWGIGFPGWHIECSAMSEKYLGKTFDVHCGGVDHIPVHHENEIAQSEAANDKKSVNYWIHGEFMMVDGKRMGKSEGNAYLIEDLMKKGFDPLAYRYLNFGTHYRIQLNFTWEALEAAQTALNRLRKKLSVLIQNDKEVSKNSIDNNFRLKFLDAINNDLNSAEALSFVWEVLKSDLSNQQKVATIGYFDQVLGLDLLKADEKVNENLELPEKVKLLLEKREMARMEKNFSLSDSIRDEIEAEGYLVVDSTDGQKVKRK